MGDPYRARRWRQGGSSGSYPTGPPAEVPGLVAEPAPPDGLAGSSNRRETLAWVGQNPARARAVLAWEQGRAEPRVSVVEVVARIAKRPA